MAIDAEITALMGCLQGEREHVLGAVEGLSDEALRCPVLCRATVWSVGVLHADRSLFFSRLIARQPLGLIRVAALHEGVLVGYVDLRGTDSQKRELGS